MKDNGIKSIRYPVEADEKLGKLAQKLGRTKKLLFMQMVDYFYKSKKDPIDLNDDILKKELVNGVNRIITFIRRLESDFLLPIFTETGKLLEINLNNNQQLKGIGEYALEDEKKSNDILLRLGLLEKAISRTQMYYEEKVQLKMRFKKLLEYYITQRETLGWPVSAAKKEDLQNHVRQSLENL
ncbi:BfmA/BtgA family mobilization protein [Pedobacter panaciterrae]